jgi:cell wall-associated NlpC family hydrolase
MAFLLAAAVAISMIPLAAAKADSTTTLKSGMSGTEVKTLQTNLVKRGYMKAADGKFGKGTLTAVKLFQKQAGLKADGVAGDTTQSILYGLTGGGKTNQTLKSGNKGDQVKILQQRLINLAYLRNASADGSFGPSTKAAVKLFQSKMSLKADGAAGPMTLIKLYSSNAPKYLTKGEQAVAYAKQFLGVKYVYGKADPSVGFDCSGLVYYVYKHYFGVTLPRSAQGMTKAGTAVDLKDAKPGDILCFGSSVSSVGHVGMYIGDNQYIEAPQTGEVVKITTLKRSVATVRRVFSDDN